MSSLEETLKEIPTDKLLKSWELDRDESIDRLQRCAERAIKKFPRLKCVWELDLLLPELIYRQRVLLLQGTQEKWPAVLSLEKDLQSTIEFERTLNSIHVELEKMEEESLSGALT